MKKKLLTVVLISLYVSNVNAQIMKFPCKRTGIANSYILTIDLDKKTMGIDGQLTYKINRIVDEEINASRSSEGVTRTMSFQRYTGETRIFIFNLLTGETFVDWNYKCSTAKNLFK
jgi:hypothetical protein